MRAGTRDTHLFQQLLIHLCHNPCDCRASGLRIVCGRQRAIAGWHGFGSGTGQSVLRPQIYSLLQNNLQHSAPREAEPRGAPARQVCIPPSPPPPPSSRSSGTFPVFDSALRTARVILRLGMFPYQQLQADDFCRWTDYSSQGCNLVRIPHTGNTQCKGEGGRRLSRTARTKPSPAGTPLAPTRLPRHSGTEAASPKTGAQRSSRAAG